MSVVRPGLTRWQSFAPMQSCEGPVTSGFSDRFSSSRPVPAHPRPPPGRPVTRCPPRPAPTARHRPVPGRPRLPRIGRPAALPRVGPAPRREPAVRRTRPLGDPRPGRRPRPARRARRDGGGRHTSASAMEAARGSPRRPRRASPARAGVGGPGDTTATRIRLTDLPGRSPMTDLISRVRPRRTVQTPKSRTPKSPRERIWRHLSPLLLRLLILTQLAFGRVRPRPAHLQPAVCCESPGSPGWAMRSRHGR